MKNDPSLTLDGLSASMTRASTMGRIKKKARSRANSDDEVWPFPYP